MVSASCCGHRREHPPCVLLLPPRSTVCKNTQPRSPHTLHTHRHYHTLSNLAIPAPHTLPSSYSKVWQLYFHPLSIDRQELTVIPVKKMFNVSLLLSE